ncbi:RNA polymerase II transcriptional coactivator SUB1 [Spathaspora sp. JA1]|nr:RNA polymerase II transcriptional coactivator SUB1 [Spathaspora sp. JA1]
MSYKRSYSNRGGGNTSSGGSAASGNETVIELDKKKQVTIRKFNNINLVDIREFYIDKDGEKKPGKKGISLTEDTWYKLLENTNKIQNALDILNGQTPKSSTPTTASKPEKKVKKQKIENSDDDEEFEDVDISKKPQQKSSAGKEEDEESEADD